MDVSLDDYQAQYEFVSGINQKLTETHRAITSIREAKAQLSAIGKRIEDDEQFADLQESATELEGKLGIPATDALSRPPERLIEMLVAAYPQLREKLNVVLQ